MGRPKVVLFHPRTRHERNYRYYHVPYSLLSVASTLEREHLEVVLIDDNVEQKVDYRGDLLVWEPDLLCVGISSMIGAQIEGGIEFAKAVRDARRDIPIVWGGALPTVLPDDTIAHPCVDIAVRGQGEETFRELVERLGNGESWESINGISYRGKDDEKIHRPPRQFADLNIFPAYTAAYSLVNLENYIWPDEHIANRTISYHSSQGCPFECGFCCEVSLWQRWWSGLSPSRILADIQYLVQRFGVNGIKFYDSEFFIDRNRALTFAQGLLERGASIHWAASAHPKSLCALSDEQLGLLRRSGLVRLLVGAESGVQQELELIGKKVNRDVMFEIARRCAQHGIFVCFTFVVGFPSMPSSHIDATLDFAEELARVEPMHEQKLHFYAPYPGSPLYKLALDSGFKPPARLEEWSRYDYYDILTPWVDPKYAPVIRQFNETHYPYLRSPKPEAQS